MGGLVPACSQISIGAPHMMEPEKWYRWVMEVQQLTKMGLEDDPEAFLITFKRVALAAQ